MADARTICKALGGRWHGSYGLAYCPAHRNLRTPALSLRDGRGGKLLAHCFVGCEFRDIAAALSGRGLCAEYRPDPENEQRRAEAEHAQRRRKLELARRCWTETIGIGGTLAERYLRARAITCALPGSLRFHPSCWHGPTASRLPAMVARVEIDGRGVGVHRTYLAEPGFKIDGDPKLMLGPCRGGATRLSDGSGPLIVAEGLETALSLLGGLSGHSPRVWAGLSTSGMAGLRLPAEPGELVLAPDDGTPGERAATKLSETALSAGWTVRIMHPPQGADWNDLVREMAREVVA